MTRERARRGRLLEIDMRSAGGALTRSGIGQFLDSAWVNFKTAGAQFGVILVDLEYLRRLDATFGMDDGEGVQESVNATLLATLRPSDAVGRWSSDELLVLIKIKQPSDLDVVAKRLRDALTDASKPFCGGLTIEPATMGVAMGVSDIRSSDTALSDALIRADVDLHDCKMRYEAAKNAAKLSGDVQTEVAIQAETKGVAKRAAA